MGGDRDEPLRHRGLHEGRGDPGKTAACDLYFGEIEKLMFDLSMWRCNDELAAYCDRKLAERSYTLSEEHLSFERKRRNYCDFWRPVSRHSRTGWSWRTSGTGCTTRGRPCTPA